MEEKRLVRTDKSLRCILYTHHKYYPLTALCLAGDNTRAHSQIKIFMFVNLIHERQFRKCCIKYDYPAQAALPGLASVSLTAPGLSTRDGGDCLFGFGCSQQSPVLNISSTLRYTSHITPWVLSLTRLRVTITRAPMPTWGGARTELWHLFTRREKRTLSGSFPPWLTGYMFRYESLCILHGEFRDQNYYDNVTKSWSCVLITQHTRNVAFSNKNDLLWEKLTDVSPAHDD